jgi:hypothetical protein
VDTAKRIVNPKFTREEVEEAVRVGGSYRGATEHLGYRPGSSWYVKLLIDTYSIDTSLFNRTGGKPGFANNIIYTKENYKKQ